MKYINPLFFFSLSLTQTHTVQWHRKMLCFSRANFMVSEWRLHSCLSIFLEGATVPLAALSPGSYATYTRTLCKPFIDVCIPSAIKTSFGLLSLSSLFFLCCFFLLFSSFFLRFLFLFRLQCQWIFRDKFFLILLRLWMMLTQPNIQNVSRNITARKSCDLNSLIFRTFLVCVLNWASWHNWQEPK